MVIAWRLALVLGRWGGFGETSFLFFLLQKTTPWKINGWNLQPSPMKRKEHHLNQTSVMMFHVNLPECTFRM